MGPRSPAFLMSSAQLLCVMSSPALINIWLNELLYSREDLGTQLIVRATCRAMLGRSISGGYVPHHL